MTSERPDPGTAHARGAVLVGIQARLIDVEATISRGLPGFTIAGVPDEQTWQMRDRVRAAALNSGLPWPAGGITVSVGPAHLTRYDCGLDLPIAVAILAAAGLVPNGTGQGCVFAAELALDGHLRPVRGVVPVLAAAAAAGGPVSAVVAPQNWPEAAILPGVVVPPCESLRQVVAWLREEYLPWEPYVPASASTQPDPGGLRVPGPESVKSNET